MALEERQIKRALLSAEEVLKQTVSLAFFPSGPHPGAAPTHFRGAEKGKSRIVSFFPSSFLKLSLKLFLAEDRL